MKSPLISVIIPIYNSALYLQKCLDSVTNQTFTNFEVILIDDGSDDSSLSIANDAAQKDTRFTIIPIHHKGAGYCRNLGLKKAKGDYIIFWDSDDFFEPKALELLFYKTQATNADIVFCGFFLYNERTKKIIATNNDINRSHLPVESFYNCKSHPHITFNLSYGMVWNNLYRRDFILKNKLFFQEQPSVNDAFFRYATESVAQKISFIDKRLINYRINHSENITSKRENNIFNAVNMINAFYNFLQKKNLLPLLKNAFLNAVLTIMYHSIDIKQPISDFLENYYINNHIKKYKMLEQPPECYIFNPTAAKWLFGLKIRNNNSINLEHFYNNDKHKIIPIVLATNNYYAPFASVTIQSVIEHTSDDKFYDIYILHTELSEDISFMLESIKNKNVRVRCINVKKILNINLYNQGRFSQEIFFRFLLPQLFYGYKKIIYLDCDIIVKSDIAQLYDTNIDHFAIAGVKNPSTKMFVEYCKKKLGLSEEKYINSGVLLINIPYWIKNCLPDKSFQIIGDCGKWITPDQDIINIVCQDKIYYLPLEWNAINSQNNLYASDISDLIKQNNIVKNAKILHFAGAKKPWIFIKHENADIWWNYAKKSLFYEYIIREYQNEHIY